eukprot:12583064-Alexandrium_andersonii.AAC.1
MATFFRTSAGRSQIRTARFTTSHRAARTAKLEPQTERSRSAGFCWRGSRTIFCEVLSCCVQDSGAQMLGERLMGPT